MSNPLLTKSFTSGGAIAPYRIVKPGTSDGKVLQAAAATDSLMGVSGSLGVDASDKRIDIIKSGIAEVEYGGNVSRGVPLTADADGKAVAAAPATGANVRVIGFAEVSGVVGDIGSMLIAPGVYQG